MTSIDAVFEAMKKIGKPTTVPKLREETGLNSNQVYAALFRLRHRGVIKASEYRSTGHGGGIDKDYWLAGADEPDPATVPDRLEPNVPLVEAAKLRCNVQAGNPFAGLMA